MNTPSVKDVATAIGNSLETIDGLRVIPYLADTFATPCALVAIEEVEFHGAFAGGDVIHTFTVLVLVSRASDRAGIELAECYMSQAGDSSIRAAFEADTTLGAVVSSAWVKKAGPMKSLAIGATGATYISVPFDIEVHA